MFALPYLQIFKDILRNIFRMGKMSTDFYLVVIPWFMNVFL